MTGLGRSVRCGKCRTRGSARAPAVGQFRVTHLVREVTEATGRVLDAREEASEPLSGGVQNGRLEHDVRAGGHDGPCLGDPCADVSRGHPLGAVAYFEHIENWRSDGGFSGLEFRS